MAEEDKTNVEAPPAPVAEERKEAAPEAPAKAPEPAKVPEAPEAPAAAETEESPEGADELPSGDEPSDSESEAGEAPPSISPFARLKAFLDDTNKFLGVYDDLVEEREKHKSAFLGTVNELRELLVALLQRYILHTMVREDFLYKHIKCCVESEELMNTEEFDEHYEEVHKAADSAVSLPELTTIKEYTQLVKEYIELGKAMNNDLIFALKRLLRKSNTVLAGHLG